MCGENMKDIRKWFWWMQYMTDCLLLCCELKGRAALVVLNVQSYNVNDFVNRLMINSALCAWCEWICKCHMIISALANVKSFINNPYVLLRLVRWYCTELCLHWYIYSFIWRNCFYKWEIVHVLWWLFFIYIILLIVIYLLWSNKRK